MSSSAVWTRAVWREDSEEIEEVIPTIWIVDDFVCWPKVSSHSAAIKAIREKWPPEEEWFKFPLLKVKVTSNSKKECDDYNETTTAEVSETSSDEEISNKRNRKRKHFGSEFQTDEIYDDELQTKIHKSKKASETICSRSAPPPPVPTKKHPGTINGMTGLPPPPVPPEVVTCSVEVHRDQQGNNRERRLSSERRLPSKRRPRLPSRSRSPSIWKSLSRSRSRSSSRTPYFGKTPVRHRSRSPRRRASLRRSPNRSRSPRRRASDRRSPSRSRLPSLTSRTSRHRSRSRSSRRSTSNHHRYESYYRSRSRDRVRSCYPMPEERFQRRVIYLLTELRDLLRNPRNNLACHQGLESNTPIIEMEQHDTLESFEEFNQRLNEKKELDLCKTAVAQIGGSDFGDHIKKAMQRCLTNSLMTKMNFTGKVKKLAFGNTNFFKMLKDVVMNMYGVTESQVVAKVVNYLKWAPERVGGGGRKK